jgi:hypothetical protein
VPPLYFIGPDAPAEFLAMVEAMTSATRIPTVVVAVIVGAVTGWFGWRLGVVLRGTTGPAPTGLASAVQPTAVPAGVAN